MNEAFYTVEADVEKVAGTHRRVHLAAGARFDVGVHGAIKEHYGIREEDRPLPVDYVVGAAGAWLVGTLNGALEAREIRLPTDAIQAGVFGYNEIRDRIPVLVRIHVRYRLATPPGTRDAVERALTRHVSRCPTARSLAGAVAVSWEAEVREGEEVWALQGT
jgi:uncharacterized OsmC-like protein